jgi:predicted DNA-binding transcriptional regulator AlpA
MFLEHTMSKSSQTQSRDAVALRRELGYIEEAELFALIDVTKGTGRNRQAAGSLPPRYKVGRKNFYKLSEVEAWIRRRRVARNDA